MVAEEEVQQQEGIMEFLIIKEEMEEQELQILLLVLL